MKIYEDGTSGCNHCWHVFRGPILMVIPDGHVVEKCCHCEATRTVHADHASSLRRKADYSSYFAPMGRYVKWDGY